MAGTRLIRSEPYSTLTLTVNPKPLNPVWNLEGSRSWSVARRWKVTTLPRWRICPSTADPKSISLDLQQSPFLSAFRSSWCSGLGMLVVCKIMRSPFRFPIEYLTLAWYLSSCAHCIHNVDTLISSSVLPKLRCVPAYADLHRRMDECMHVSTCRLSTHIHKLQSAHTS